MKRPFHFNTVISLTFVLFVSMALWDFSMAEVSSNQAEKQSLELKCSGRDYAIHTSTEFWCRRLDESGRSFANGPYVRWYGNIQAIRIKDGSGFPDKDTKSMSGFLMSTEQPIYMNGSYSMGKKEGQWKTFSTDGTLIRKENFESNVLNGTFLESQEGEWTLEGQYEKGKPTGSWTLYDKNRKTLKQGSYKDVMKERQKRFLNF